MDLDQLKSKATAANARREEAETAKVAEKRKPRFSRARLTIWILEAIAVLAALDYFIWEPWRQRANVRKEAQTEQVIGAPAPLLGDEAMALRGLKEVADSRLAALEGLAEGAATAQAAQVEVSQERKLPIEVENSIGMRFRLIPNGSFIMGSPDDEPGRMEDEQTHVGGIRTPLYVGKLEVTQRQWEAVMGREENPSGFAGPQKPVEEVSWYDCQKFLLALAEKEGLPKWTYRLPTEADWEYACRAGSSTAYHFGNDPQRLKLFDFYDRNSYGHTQPCGLKRPNAYGLHDMHGNVWEWCRNLYAEYSKPDLEPDGDTSGQWRALRGGNFYVTAAKCRAATRARLPPASHGNMLGFRVMRAIPELFENIDMPPLPSADTNVDGNAETEGGQENGE